MKILIKRFCWNLVKSFGLIWLLVAPVLEIIEQPKNIGIYLYFIIIVLSLIISCYLTKPKKRLERSISGNNSKVIIEVGDLFKKETHIIVGTNDVFDTEFGEQIKPESVQGQFTLKFYNGEISKLNEEIDSRIRSKEVSGEVDKSKTKGKNIRYPIGTTISLGNAARRVYFSAYARMDSNLVCESKSDWMWDSMNQIWEEIRLSGHGEEVSIPIIGSELARVGLSRLTLVQMIIISFVTANKTSPISNCLNVIVYSSDVKKLDFVALEHFLESIDV